MSEDQAQKTEITINIKGPSELKLQITITTDKTVLELKEAIATKSDVAADRQRLIYSGRVLKDDDALSEYKIQSSHTIHMVKGVSKSSSASMSESSSTPQQLPTMQTGQNVHDPLTQLNSHLGFGAMAGLNPFGDMGLNPNDPNMMQSMLNSPQFLQQMSSMLSNPAIMDQIIAMDPRLAAMSPQVRTAFQDERFRQMISNPETLQQVLRMSNMMREAGIGGGVGMLPFGVPPSFPAPGSPSTNTPTGSSAFPPFPAVPTSNNSSTTGTTNPVNPFALFGAAPAAGAGIAAPGGTSGSPDANPTANPTPGFPFDPSLMQQMLGLGSFGGPGAGGLGSYGQLGLTSPPPSDSRPPEERFQVQLQQLQDMGFNNASQNVRALLATGGNIHSAIEYILSGGGL